MTRQALGVNLKVDDQSKDIVFMLCYNVMKNLFRERVDGLDEWFQTDMEQIN